MHDFFSSGRHINIPIGNRTGGFRFTHSRTIGGTGGNLTTFGVSHAFPSNINNSGTFGILQDYAGERTRLLENREINEAARHHPLLQRPQSI